MGGTVIIQHMMQLVLQLFRSAAFCQLSGRGSDS